MKDGISIVMAYHNRRELLIKTLHSINKSKFDKMTLIKKNIKRNQNMPNKIPLKISLKPKL
jgi:hypothetical protein